MVATWAICFKRRIIILHSPTPLAAPFVERRQERRNDIRLCQMTDFEAEMRNFDTIVHIGVQYVDCHGNTPISRPRRSKVLIPEIPSIR